MEGVETLGEHWLKCCRSISCGGQAAVSAAGSCGPALWTLSRPTIACRGSSFFTKLVLMDYGGPWLGSGPRVVCRRAHVGQRGRSSSCLFQATQGLKQGCSLSPTLFSLFITD